MIHIASEYENHIILKTLQKKGCTFNSLEKNTRIRSDVLKNRLEKLVKFSLIIPPSYDDENYQISSLGKIVLEDLRKDNKKYKK
jgi:predicted transcriptional regulator